MQLFDCRVGRDWLILDAGSRDYDSAADKPLICCPTARDDVHPETVPKPEDSRPREVGPKILQQFPPAK